MYHREIVSLCKYAVLAKPQLKSHCSLADFKHLIAYIFSAYFYLLSRSKPLFLSYKRKNVSLAVEKNH